MRSEDLMRSISELDYHGTLEQFVDNIPNALVNALCAARNKPEMHFAIAIFGFRRLHAEGQEKTIRHESPEHCAGDVANLVKVTSMLIMMLKLLRSGSVTIPEWPESFFPAATVLLEVVPGRQEEIQELLGPEIRRSRMRELSERRPKHAVN
jgi:hypothetical protein